MAQRIPAAERGSEAVLALSFLKRELIGVACYDPLDALLHLGAVRASPSDVDEMVQRIKEQTNPKLTLLHSQVLQDHALIDAIQRPLATAGLELRADGDDPDDVDAASSASASASAASSSSSSSSSSSPKLAPIKVLKRASFDKLRGRERIEELPAYRACPFNVDLECDVLVQAAGALLAHLSGGRSNDGGDEAAADTDEGGVGGGTAGKLDTHYSLTRSSGSAVLPVRDIVCFRLDDFMAIDAVSLRALQICTQEEHPSQIAGAARAKEGFSLYGILNRTYSTVGRRQLKRWMLKPVMDCAELERRYDALQTFMAPRNAELVKLVSKHLRKVRDAPRLLLRIKTVRDTWADWAALFETCHHGRCIAEQLASVLRQNRQVAQDDSNDDDDDDDDDDAGAHERCLSDVVAAVQIGERSSLYCVERIISDFVDVDASDTSRNFEIREGVSKELDAQRATYEQLDQLLTDSAGQLLEHYDLNELSVEYLPQIGFCIVLRGQDAPPPGFRFQYQRRDDEGVEERYYKDEYMDEFDNRYGDVRSAITDLTNDMKRQIEDLVLEHEVAIHHAIDALARLDALLSLAAASAEYGYCRPHVEYSTRLIVQGGRHPLQEFTVDQFQPNDTLLMPMATAGDGSNGDEGDVEAEAVGTIAMVTGANGSGKVRSCRAGSAFATAPIYCTNTRAPPPHRPLRAST